MHFYKSWILKFQNCFRHSLSIATREINCIDSRAKAEQQQYDARLKKRINNYYIYK